MDTKTKAQKRAPNDARTAWRKMTPEDRADFVAWMVEVDLPVDDGLERERPQVDEERGLRVRAVPHMTGGTFFGVVDDDEVRRAACSHRHGSQDLALKCAREMRRGIL